MGVSKCYTRDELNYECGMQFVDASGLPAVISNILVQKPRIPMLGPTIKNNIIKKKMVTLIQNYTMKTNEFKVAPTERITRVTMMNMPTNFGGIILSLKF